MTDSAQDDASNTTPKDMSASIRTSLRRRARAHNEDMQYILSRYALERLLYRLGRSRYADKFVVKGALLFVLWRDHPHRQTRDLDLLAFGAPSADRMQQVFTDLCALPIDEPDGLSFQQETLKVTSIREMQEYGGLRVTLLCLLGETRFHVQVDIGFGDVVTPHASYADFPTLIGLASPHVKVYPPETVVAEKYEALVRLGAINSRVKDFYDLWTLASERTFSGAVLAQAIHSTFKRRGAALPATTPFAFTDSFISDPAKLQLWQAFVGRTGLDPVARPLAETVELICAFLMTPTQALVSQQPFHQRWAPGGPWQ